MFFELPGRLRVLFYENERVWLIIIRILFESFCNQAFVYMCGPNEKYFSFGPYVYYI